MISRPLSARSDARSASSQRNGAYRMSVHVEPETFDADTSCGLSIDSSESSFGIDLYPIRTGRGPFPAASIGSLSERARVDHGVNEPISERPDFEQLVGE